MYENLVITIQTCLPLIVLLLFLIFMAVASMWYNADKREHRLILIQRTLDEILKEIKGIREGSAAERKRDSEE